MMQQRGPVPATPTTAPPFTPKVAPCLIKNTPTLLYSQEERESSLGFSARHTEKHKKRRHRGEAKQQAMVETSLAALDHERKVAMRDRMNLLLDLQLDSSPQRELSDFTEIQIKLENRETSTAQTHSKKTKRSKKRSGKESILTKLKALPVKDKIVWNAPSSSKSTTLSMPETSSCVFPESIQVAAGEVDSGSQAPKLSKIKKHFLKHFGASPLCLTYW